MDKMNYLTFHNREKIDQAYIYGPNNYRCIMCSYQYHPQYLKAENTFLLLDCQHLIHRQCFKSMHRQIPENWKSACPLCQKVEQFDTSAFKAREARRDREEKMQEQNDYDYEEIVHTVDKTGKYSFK